MVEIAWILLAASSMLAILPASVLLLECVAALFPARQVHLTAARRPSLAVLVPAHNESLGLLPTLASISPQLADRDRLVVIADNCTDDTAEVARKHGAHVLVRNDASRRGKGFALQFALDWLAQAPPEVVVIVDADCVVEACALELLARQAIESARPAQAAYRMPPPERPTRGDLISSLAVLVKNVVRPRGLARLGLPCLLTGSGMAIPWPLFARASLSGSHLVEDMQFSVDLALAGHAPSFCADARVTAPLPAHRAAARSQRTRWEHGHLQTIVTQAPRLLAGVLRRGRLAAAVLLAELCVPPLSLLVALVGAGLALAVGAAVRGGNWLPAGCFAVAMVQISLAVLLAWWKLGRRDVPPRVLINAPFYLLAKLPLYCAFLFRRQRTWVRTQRDSAPSTPSHGSSFSGR